MEIRNHSLIIIVMVFLVHYLSLSFAMAAVTYSISSDQDALLALKAHITHDPNNLLSKNWSTSNSICNWIGVTCGVRHHRVTALNISDFGLTGTISPGLGNLSFLSVLVITNNSFHGSLPDDLARLRRLKFIDFNFNNFDMEIPSWFGSFPKLQRLFLRNNKFVGPIPVSLANISSLEKLDLGYNQLSGTIPKEFWNLTIIKEIFLDHNELQGEIPKELGNLAELEILTLAKNDLTGPIPSLIFNLSTLITMDFSNNSLTGSLPDNMCQYLPFLEELLMSYNQLAGPIPCKLWHCTKLRIVSLENNQFNGSIPRDVGNLTSIKILDLGYNNLTGAMPHEIGNLGNLEVLWLNENHLRGVVPDKIFNISTTKAIAISENNVSGILPSNIDLGLPNLERLHLWGNRFSGPIPSSITNISNLNSLELSSNKFTGFIPSTIGNLRSLEWLNLGDNYLKSSTPDLSFLSSLTNCKNLESIGFNGNPINGILPRSIGNLSTSLVSIVAYDCSIRGNIPEEIGNLSNLRVLFFDNNELTGSIPLTVGRLQKLQGLYFPNNKLEGSIPGDLCHLHMLVDLHFHRNKLSGSLPACLGNLNSLRDLSLGSNAITSVIPPSLWNLKDILHFDLSSNRLDGLLPFDMGNMEAAIDIDLSRNRFSGHIPTSIGGLKNLQHLSLRYNRIQGPIPESFGELISLEFLDLSDNNISGDIPESLEGLLYLKHLNLSFNWLEGEIPRGGPFANFSAESFRGNHALCGSPQLQVLPCKTSSRQKKWRNIVLPPSITATVIVLLALILVTLRCQNRKTEPVGDSDMLLNSTWRRISYYELVRATDGFTEHNLLGIGSFGSVYKGTLQDGMNVAVKVFHQQFEEAFKSFDAECEVMSNIRHRNLVKIITSCSNEHFKALVLEYIPNGSLEKFLYSDDYFLNILQRLNIMIDLASVLEYLHFGYSVPVIHCDLKPSNVLLDEDLVARLSDFGISKLLGEDQSMTHTRTLASIGYMAPEYGREGKVSRKVDVYSYGIMLMETFTRKRPTDEFFFGEMSLKHWINDSLPSSVMKVVDKNLLRREDEHFSAKEKCVSSILSLAMECTREYPVQRINIKEVASGLFKIRDTLLADTPIRRV